MHLPLQGIARHDLLLAAAVDVDPGVDRAGQDLLDHLVGGGDPVQLPSLRSLLHPPGHLQLLVEEVALDSPRVLRLGKLGEQGVPGGPHALMRVEYDRAIRLAAIADR